ncbi:MAG: hypothetical protein ABIK68_05545 [bacterium]
MLKKIMKAALAASLVFGFSSMAMAEANVSGDVASYFGQYNTGATGYSAHFITASEGHINVTGASGPIKAFLQVESRDDRYGFGGNNLNNAQLNVTYTVGALGVTLGTVNEGLACEMGLSSGLKTTTTLGYGAAGGCAGYFEQDGIQLSYAIPAIKGAVYLTVQPTTLGQITAFSAAGMIADMVGFRFNTTSDVADDYSVSTDSKVTDTYNHVAVLVPLGTPKMTLSVEVNTTEDKSAGVSTKNERTDTLVQFKGADLGPGMVIATYATKAAKAAGTKTATITDMDLVYRLDLDKGVGADFFYLSQATKSELPGGTTTTKTWIGGGLFASF